MQGLLYLWPLCLMVCVSHAMTSQSCNGSVVDPNWIAKCKQNSMYFGGVVQGLVVIEDPLHSVNRGHSRQLEDDVLSSTRGLNKGVTSTALRMMKDFRGKTNEWYESAYTRLTSALCDMQPEKMRSRCVSRDDTSAYKDGSNTCVTMYADPDSCALQGKCESVGNCRWLHPQQNGTRKERFNKAFRKHAKEWFVEVYTRSFLPFVLPGVLFAVFALFSWLIFCFLRCCCNLCWGRNPQTEGYSQCEIVVPTAVFLAATFGILVCASISYQQNQDITKGIYGMVSAVNKTVLNMEVFSNSIIRPLDSVSSTVNSTSKSISQNLGNSSWIQADMTELSEMLKTYGNIYSNFGPFPTNCTDTSGVCVRCDKSVCGIVKSSCNEASKSVKDATDALQGAVDAMQISLASNEKLISESVNMAKGFVVRIQKGITTWKTQVEDLRSQFESVKHIQLGSVMAMFVLGLIVSFFGILGIMCGFCSRKNAFIHSLHMSWILGVMICVVGFLLATVMIVLAVIWSDGCQFLTLVQKDFSPLLNHKQATIMNACFRNETLIKALNLEESFSFTCKLDESFLKTDSLNVAKSFQPLFQYGDRVNGYTRQQFGFDESHQRKLLDNLNLHTSGGRHTLFTVHNYRVPWTLYKDTKRGSCSNLNDWQCDMLTRCGSKAMCYQSFLAFAQYEDAFKDVDNKLAEMKKDFTSDNEVTSKWKDNFTYSITSKAKNFTTRLQNLHTNSINTLKIMLRQGIARNVEQFKCAMHCGWINGNYQQLHNNLCTTLLGATLTIAICIFTMSLLLIPIVICAIILQKRLRGVKKGSKAAKTAVMSKKMAANKI